MNSLCIFSGLMHVKCLEQLVAQHAIFITRKIQLIFPHWKKWLIYFNGNYLPCAPTILI